MSVKRLLFLLVGLCVLAIAATGHPYEAWAFAAVIGALLAKPSYCLNSNVAGFLSTSNAQPTDLVGEWQEGILVRNGKGYNTGSTLFGLMSRLKTEPVDDMFFNWWERDPVTVTFYSIANATSGATTIGWYNVLNGASGPNSIWQLLDVNAIILNSRTKEYVQVTAQPTSDTVTVNRGLFGTTPTAILQNDIWTFVTLGKDEGTGPVRAAYQQPSSYVNYIQTFNSSVFLTNAYKMGFLRTNIEGPLRDLRAYALEVIANRIEFGYFLGQPAALTGTNGFIYLTGGLQAGVDAAGLTQNALNGNGVAGVALSAVKTWLMTFMVNGSDTKLGFCGPQAYTAFNDYANTAAGGFRIMNQETVFGMNITNIMTPLGELSLAMHPLFRNAAAYQGYMMVVDLQLIVQKVAEPLFLEAGIQVPGTDAYQEQFRGKYGLKQKFPAAFGYAYNLQSIIAG